MKPTLFETVTACIFAAIILGLIGVNLYKIWSWETYRAGEWHVKAETYQNKCPAKNILGQPLLAEYHAFGNRDAREILRCDYAKWWQYNWNQESKP